MNRRQRRAAGRRRLTPREIEQHIACPDCTADVIVTEVAPGVMQGDVYHDPTCPWLARFTANGGLGVRFVHGEDQ